MSPRARQRRKVIPLHARERIRVTVVGPSDPGQAKALRRAIVQDLADLAVELLADGRLPRPAVAASDADP